MFLEERVESLEETIQKLQNEIRFLKKQSADEYLTPKEFAHRMKFSENTCLLYTSYFDDTGRSKANAKARLPDLCGGAISNL